MYKGPVVGEDVAWLEQGETEGNHGANAGWRQGP